MTASLTLAGKSAYVADESEDLISKSTWPLKLSGLVFAGLLVIGRSASYGNVTWTPAYHAASSPLVVQLGSHKPAPVMPKIGNIDALMSKASAANEVIVFHPGNSGDGQDGNGDGSGAGDKSQTANNADHEDHSQGSAHGSGNGAGTAHERDLPIRSGGSGTAGYGE